MDWYGNSEREVRLLGDGRLDKAQVEGGPTEVMAKTPLCRETQKRQGSQTAPASGALGRRTGGAERWTGGREAGGRREGERTVPPACSRSARAGRGAGWGCPSARASPGLHGSHRGALLPSMSGEPPLKSRVFGPLVSQAWVCSQSPFSGFLGSTDTAGRGELEPGHVTWPTTHQGVSRVMPASGGGCLPGKEASRPPGRMGTLRGATGRGSPLGHWAASGAPRVKGVGRAGQEKQPATQLILRPAPLGSWPQ